METINRNRYLRAVEILTPRETQILKLVEKGFTNKEIAGKLYLSERTIHAHRRSMHDKLNVRGRNGLIKWLYRIRNEKNG